MNIGLFCNYIAMPRSGLCPSSP